MPTVGFDHRAITLDGQRRLLLSGAIHYPRSTPAMWPQLMRRSREAGLNTIETYVFWNLHEARRGVLDFSGRLDLAHFCRLAQQEGLYVVLRIGPYVCGEASYGGLPSWLREVPGMRIRTWNQPFMQEIERWMRLLCEHLGPLFGPRGGPIILAQAENEYNLVAKNYGEEGQRYLKWHVELGMSLNLGIPWVMCVGGAQGAMETINGQYGHLALQKHFERHPEQPALWTEAYPGWYDAWGYAHHIRPSRDIAYAVARFIGGGGTGVNYYMWHGGTNFAREAMYMQATSYGFDAPLDEWGLPTTKLRHLRALHGVLAENAAVILGSDARPAARPLGARQTAFEYQAAGRRLVFLCNDDLAAPADVEFEGTRRTLAPGSVQIVGDGGLLLDTADMKAIRPIRRAMLPARGALSGWSWWAEPLPARRPDLEAAAIEARRPIEQVKLTADQSDYCWYTTRLKVARKQEGMLSFDGVADLVHVFVDGKLAATTALPLVEDRGAFDAPAWKQSFRLTLGAGTHELALLCVSLGLVKGDWMIGHQNLVMERKGIWASVKWQGKELPGPWTMVPGLWGEAAGVMGPGGRLVKWGRAAAGGTGRPLRWWRCGFAAPDGQEALSLDLGGMNKGLIYLNGQCLGRYWLMPATRPSAHFPAGSDRFIDPDGQPTQRYYHLPRQWLRGRGRNELVLFEELGGDPRKVRLCRWK